MGKLIIDGSEYGGSGELNSEISRYAIFYESIKYELYKQLFSKLHHQ